MKLFNTSVNIFRIGIFHNYREVKQYSITNNIKTNNKQDDSNQIPDLKNENQYSELSKISSFKLNTGYQLNFKNYIQELYKALIKECKYNLLDLNSLNKSLDFESLMSVSHRTLKAIKVFKNKLKDKTFD